MKNCGILLRSSVAWHGLQAIAFVLLCVVGCSNEVDDPVDVHEARWQMRQIRRFVVETCTNGIEPPGCVRTVVEDNAVVESQEQVFVDGSSWEETATPVKNPVVSMFDAARDDSLEEGCEIDDVRFSEEYAFVRSFNVRCDGVVTGGQRIVCFLRDELDINECDDAP